MMQTCKQCGTLKEDTCFYTSRRECKSCTGYNQKMARTPEWNKRRRLRQQSPTFKAKKAIADRKYHQKTKGRYHWAHRDEILIKQAIYRKNNREKLRAYDTAYQARRALVDPLFAFRRRVRSLIRKAIQRKGYGKLSATQAILGCDYPELLSHLISTWNRNYPSQELNWKTVHIDHIIPIASAKTETEVMQLNHYHNLQLLLAEDNLRKSDIRVLQAS